MVKKIETASAPKAIGPYSQAVVSQGFVFVSGQLPIDPVTGILVEGDIGQMTAQILRNISGILEEAGTSLDQVVRTEIFLTDMGDFAQVNKEYGNWFAAGAPPARQTVQVARLPMNAPIEISCIAATPSQEPQ